MVARDHQFGTKRKDQISKETDPMAQDVRTQDQASDLTVKGAAFPLP